MANRFSRLACALALLPLFGSAPLWAKTFVYVSNADSGSVSRYQLDTQSGALTLLGDTLAAKKIMPLAVSPDKKRLYGAVRSKPWSVISWRIDEQTGDLHQLAMTPVAASYPYITTDRSGHYLLAASYDSDIVTSQPVNPQGVVSGQESGRYHTGPHAHSVIADYSNHSLYVGNLGADRVLQLELHNNGAITPIGKGYVQAEKNSGPRHSAISPDNRFVYNLTEMSGSITQYQRLPDGALQKVASWPNAVAGQYHLQPGRERSGNYSDPTPRIWAADIKITPDGRYLYASERTSGTVSGYRVDKQSGKLQLIGSWPVEKQPRGMAVDDSGKWLVVSGEKSAVVGSYAIDPQSGKLTRTAQAPCGKDANWVAIVSY